ncbi:unnamed protein product [Symbiodinium natans]|uniref:Uncharacterized protein n=1 Tax=Symbiodinium natans TaxID=878477 RepID=A0A812SLZ0_9DINO|nr:unnamed protein product [Symbiodinium natans]
MGPFCTSQGPRSTFGFGFTLAQHRRHDVESTSCPASERRRHDPMLPEQRRPPLLIPCMTQRYSSASVERPLGKLRNASASLNGAALHKPGAETAEKYTFGFGLTLAQRRRRNDNCSLSLAPELQLRDHFMGMHGPALGPAEPAPNVNVKVVSLRGGQNLTLASTLRRHDPLFHEQRRPPLRITCMVDCPALSPRREGAWVSW